MASAPPTAPPLPISTSQTSQSAPSQATITTTPTFRAFISRLSDSVRHTLSLRRPWLELLDRSSLSRPDSLSDAAARISKNASYFCVNYILLLTSVLALSLLSHPLSLLLSTWLFLYLLRPSEPPIVLLGRTFSDREILASLVVLTVIVVFIISVGSLKSPP